MLRHYRPVWEALASSGASRNWVDKLEVVLLCLAAPFLLFPTVSLAGTLAACIALVPIWLLRKAAGRSLLSKTPFNGALLIWLAACFMGVAVSVIPALTLPKATGLLLGITLWRTLAIHVTDAKRRHLALLLYLLAAAFIIGVGATNVAWQTKVPWLGRIVDQLPKGGVRLPEGSAAGVHANEVAGTVLLCWPLSLAVWAGRGAPAEPGSRMARWYTTLCGVMVVTGGGLLLLLQSRAGWLGAAAGLASLYFLGVAQQRRERRGKLNYKVVLTALTAGAVAAGVCLALGRSIWPVSADQTILPESVSFRLEVWRYALEAIGDFPLTGVGLGTFRQVVLRLYPITVYANPDIAHAHNIILQVALDTGLPGLCAYVALLAIAAAVCGKELLELGGRQSVLAKGMLATLVAVHVFGLADAIAPGAKPGLLFWWLLGLAATLPEHTAS